MLTLLRERDANEFNITFEGDIKSVDVTLLTSTLLNFNTIIQEINKELKTGKQVSLQIQTFEPGSYDIFCALAGDSNLANTLFSMLSKENFQLAGTVISVLADILSIKEFLGGKKAKNIETKNDDSIVITNNKGDVLVKNAKAGDIIFNNPTINITVNNTFDALKEVPQIDGLAVKNNRSENLFKTDKKGFSRLALQNEMLDEESEETRTVPKYNIPLNIFKIVFGEKYKWEFYFEGNRIAAQIKDDKFYKRLLNGEENFMNGDILMVDLEIFQVFNKVAKTFENRKYLVTAVHNVRHPSRQQKLDF